MTTALIPFDESERNAVFGSYARCALFTVTDEAGRPLEDDEDISQLTSVAVEQMREDCEDFLTANLELLRRSGLSTEQIGQDFWLTRNSHGAGFWDRGLGTVGTELSEAAKAYSGFDLFLNSDGQVMSARG